MTSAERGSRDGFAAVLEEFLDAFRNLDLDRFLSCWAHDATVIHPAALTPRRQDGWDAVCEGWQVAFEYLGTLRSAPPYVDLTPLDLKVQRLGDRVAVVTFHLDLGEELGLGRRTLVFAHRGGRWKIVHLHASNA